MTLIIAEAGVNHNGDIGLAHKLVDAAYQAGADVVKFQTFKAKHLVTADAKQADYQIANTQQQESQLDMLSRLELTFEAHFALKQQCEQRGIEFLSTAFDSESLAFLVNDLGLMRLKLPSGELTNAPLILEHARTGCDLIVSTGMATLAEVEAALGVIAFGYTAEIQVSPSVAAFKQAYRSEQGQAALREKVTLLHCTTEYPAPLAEINLRAMDTLSKQFQLPTGYSDHSEGITVPIAAVARGASVIEKHFTLDKTMSGPDHKASLNPEELSQMVAAIRGVELALGSGEKVPQASEMKNMTVARKSLVANGTIAKGEMFSVHNIAIKRPGSGMSLIVTGISSVKRRGVIITRETSLVSSLMSSLVSSNKRTADVIVLGAGGHTSVLVDMLRQQDQAIAGIVSADLALEDNKLRSVLEDLPQYFSDDDVLAFPADSVCLVNGIGAIPKRLTRIKLFNNFKAQGYRFASVISQQAIISPFASLGEGVQVMPGAIIQAGAIIGDNCIINTGAIVEHDSVIEAHSHIAPRATLCGQVHVGQGAFIGANAVVIQNINIGREAVIAAGARVHKHVQAGETVI